MGVNEIIERRVLRDNDVVFREGEPGSNAYILQDGAVVISKVINGVEEELAVIGRGGIFGEMALIDDKPRMATARVRGNATIMTVTKQIYSEKLKKSDPFVRALLRILVETVRSTSKS